MIRNIFWAISVLSALLLTGCATTSTPELIEKAQLTGNRTAVNARYDTLDRAEGKPGKMCPAGTKPWCDERIEKESCSCVSSSSVRDRINSVLGH